MPWSILQRNDFPAWILLLLEKYHITHTHEGEGKSFITFPVTWLMSLRIKGLASLSIFRAVVCFERSLSFLIDWISFLEEFRDETNRGFSGDGSLEYSDWTSSTLKRRVQSRLTLRKPSIQIPFFWSDTSVRWIVTMYASLYRSCS
jgi:hypothetical protein